MRVNIILAFLTPTYHLGYGRLMLMAVPPSFQSLLTLEFKIYNIFINVTTSVYYTYETSKTRKKTHLDPLLSLPICLSEKPGFLPLAAFLFNRN